jgi:serine/tyrosine/threonine adenylyltransferase
MTSPGTPITEQFASDPQHPIRFDFDNTYIRLPERFYARVAPTPVAAPRLIKLNADLARALRLDPEALMSPQGIELLAGNRLADGSEPIALAYAGHQFGHFVPQLGDGRAILLGEVKGTDGKRYDIQLKGSGMTPYSRRGDGRAVLGPVLREYIVSEAMAALGMPTARALAAVTTGERVLRETVLPGAVFTRVAASHLRVGTFEYFAARRDTEGVRILADYAIARHYPEAAETRRTYRALLDAVIARQAELVAQWMLIGFVHGVMNTDNTAISGETIDYGPCAFMEAYDPATVFSSIDAQGRYAYGNQPRIALWNLTRLAEALLPLLQQEEGDEKAAITSANQALEAFPQIFENHRLSGFRRKLGLFSEREGDQALIHDLLECMTVNKADFTWTFRALSNAAEQPQLDRDVRLLFANPTAYDAWAAQWRLRIKDEPNSPAERAEEMRTANPAFIPRNHLVEAVINAALERQDFQPFEELLAVTSLPYDDQPGRERYAAPARPEEAVTQTFCGT